MSKYIVEMPEGWNHSWCIEDKCYQCSGTGKYDCPLAKAQEVVEASPEELLCVFEVNGDWVMAKRTRKPCKLYAAKEGK